MFLLMSTFCNDKKMKAKSPFQPPAPPNTNAVILGTFVLSSVDKIRCQSNFKKCMQRQIKQVMDVKV